MDLSILIVTVPPRKKYLNRLLTILQNQIVKDNLQDKIEILVYEDDFEKSIGEKKNKLYGLAKGKYVVTIDDDDIVSDNYCKLICDAIDKYDVDQICIGHRYYHNNTKSWIPMVVSNNNHPYQLKFLKIFDLYYTKFLTNSKYDFELYINNLPLLRIKGLTIKTMIFKLFSEIFKKSVTQPNVTLRYTCHTTPIRRDITKSIKFSDIHINEDVEWATKLYEKGLIKSEHIINEDLYYYYYDDDMSIQKLYRLGIDNKKKLVTEILTTTKDFVWELQDINKIDIKWI